MATKKTANKYDDLLKLVHNGIDPDQPVHKAEQEEKVTVPTDIIPDDSDTAKSEPEPELDNAPASITTTISTELPLSKAPAKRKRKTQDDYQEAFFVRVDFTHRKPLYITAATHRRLMRIVHLMDDPKLPSAAMWKISFSIIWRPLKRI